ncbi:hypothetical protein CDAR_546361 [Caerostris darwini]|uniref:Uncharacterized protein n=1 Tax=Caerostris darwini TaxID=1538125 RepID=A0AAV4RNK6_9ARAC|nr:hypothetical protein CDAR_546361 [Caerostris darwini]
MWASVVSRPLAADVHINDKAVRAFPVKVFLFSSEIYGSLRIVVLDRFLQRALKDRWLHKQKTVDKNSPIALGNAIKSDITVDGAILRKSFPFPE